MTEQERANMMAEIMGVVDKHISKSEGKDSGEDAYMPNPDLDKINISKARMDAWKEEYKRIRVDGKTILEEVRRNPIDVSKLDGSFDVMGEYNAAILDTKR